MDAQKAIPQKRERAGRVSDERREQILHAAFMAFGREGFSNASLATVAADVGLTQQGVLHYFKSKRRLLQEVLEYRDREAARDLPEDGPPSGGAYFSHLLKVVRRNAEQPGMVQAYTVLSAESVTDEHPAKDWFRFRYRRIRAKVQADFDDAFLGGPPPDDVTAAAAASILAVMDGLQLQWLLDPENVDLVATTEWAMSAIAQAARTEARRAAKTRAGSQPKA